VPQGLELVVILFEFTDDVLQRLLHVRHKLLHRVTDLLLNFDLIMASTL